MSNVAERCNVMVRLGCARQPLMITVSCGQCPADDHDVLLCSDHYGQACRFFRGLDRDLKVSDIVPGAFVGAKCALLDANIGDKF